MLHNIDFINNLYFTYSNINFTFNILIFILLSLLLAIFIDIIYGELPTKIHPVVLIGSLISFFKNRFIKINNKWSGFLLTLFVCSISSVILIILLYLFSFNIIIFYLIFTIILSSTFSIKMLLDTAKNIEKDLKEDINKARQNVSYLVSRNTDELTESFIVSATIESLSENITDSYISPVFYFMILSILGIFIHSYNFLFILLLIPFNYRIFNTLDAMVGYKTDELINIGFVPAKIDDILNYIPARISGLFVVLSAWILKFNYKNSYKIMKRDARNCPSPNSGFTMATTAGALDIQLIKIDTYILGDNNKNIEINDINKAVKLSNLTILLFTLAIVIFTIILYVIL
ncbi:cobalamin biosynthesis protein [uncultured Methanobrevibacter sp.]|uniref:cobalamin biosynthesis protein n=1 Tax=uncultured Methanobrevibacter sp. TaxID=253161 RepID=UPI00261815A0|nr:cobalamin biosynthesis protein [uncultured Methanobrevibacter sp.]